MKKNTIIILSIFLIAVASTVCGSLMIRKHTGVSIFLFCFGLFSLIMFFTIIGIYNKLVNVKNKVSEAFALVDIKLKLRFDLIPNLVNVVKGYTKHERELLTNITNLRNLADSATDKDEKLDYANKLIPQLKNLIAVAEGYPALKSNTLYQSLMKQITEVEDRIVAARRVYDSNVSIYNTAIESFPANIIAHISGFTKEKLYNIDASENISFEIK